MAMPHRIALEGFYTRLEPLDPIVHGEQLYAAVSGIEADRLHKWLPDSAPLSRDEFEAWLVRSAQSLDPLFFAVIDKSTGRAEGRQGLMDINTVNGVAEIGHILWGPRIARSRVTTEAFFLMADYAFRLGVRRWQWRCNALNEPSRRAAERFGYRFEGVFRNHMVIKGANRDTAWYSITDAEWQSLKMKYEVWLAPENFDECGIERFKLSARQGSEN
ncbi:GNAT family N-acetyltransferase [Ensifer sp. ENS06]|uniref:GNAT family N-acetyltransferase n=1 Tax=Ensifer sp. ENS06 TaxID=2769276 RepID=UPI001AED2518|nr:GNAT family protein [Ensifer sp. ENS06]